jgi:hypothetical protein
MKKLWIIGAVALMATSTLLANPIMTVGGKSGYGPYQTGSGGEFTIAIGDWCNILGAGYVPGKTMNVIDTPTGWTATIQTFCVETGEGIAGNTVYNAYASDQSMLTGKQLTLGAAWLYHQFQIGELAGYDWTRDPAGVNETQQLQNAIWYFMGAGITDPNNPFIELGMANGGFDLNNGTIPVKVLNVWGARNPCEPYQDMLVCWVPDGGMTLTLLGLGLGSLAFVSRRIRK